MIFDICWVLLTAVRCYSLRRHVIWLHRSIDRFPIDDWFMPWTWIMRGGKVNKRSLAGEFSLSFSLFQSRVFIFHFFFSDGETSALIIVKASQPPLVTTLNSHQHFQLNAPFKNILPREIAAHISTYRYRSFSLLPVAIRERRVNTCSTKQSNLRFVYT